MYETFDVNNYKLRLDIPDHCPVCGYAAEIKVMTNNPYLVPKKGRLSDRKAQMMFQCPRDACSSLFLGTFSWDRTRRAARNGLAPVSYSESASSNECVLVPETVRPYDCNNEIQSISPMFYKIACQAAHAESSGLNEIAGMGFRKALEFLIKDFCISESPSERISIEKNTLAKVISDYIQNPNVVDCAHRAAWLGNDETHYKRKWTQHDITDLKNLIKLTEAWIETELRTKKYRDELKKNAAPN